MAVRQAATLYAQLLNTGLQQKDQPLYQVIYNLINGLLNVQAINTNTVEVISGLVFTPGSIIYAGADGKITQQNSGLFFDYTNVRVGIGTNSPVAPLDVPINNIKNISTDGVLLENRTPATAGFLVQMAPRLKLRGSAWNGASSDFIDTFLELLPQSGTTRGQIKIGMSRNGASTFYPVTIDGNPTTAVANMTIAGNGAYRSGGDGTAASPTFGWVNSGGGGSIGFYTPAANDLNLVCNSANQILWGVALWRNSANLSMGWASSVDPNSTIADTLFIRKATAKIKFYTSESSETAGFVLDFSTDAIAMFRNRADAAYATIDCLDIKTEDATFFHKTGVTLIDNAAANLATLLNAPTAGDPTKWIAIDDNGTTRFIPAW